jgi:hypothetical protein
MMSSWARFWVGRGVGSKNQCEELKFDDFRILPLIQRPPSPSDECSLFAFSSTLNNLM